MTERKSCGGGETVTKTTDLRVNLIVSFAAAKLASDSSNLKTAIATDEVTLQSTSEKHAAGTR